MKLAAPKNASFGGCGRSFTAAPDPEATPLENFDAEFVFPTSASPADPKKKQIPFTCVLWFTFPHLTLLSRVT
jgi:hypothetical protein